MKFSIAIMLLLLIFSCSQKDQNATSKKDSTIVAIDSVAVNIDSSKIENFKHEEVEYEEPKDGFYSKDYLEKHFKAKVYYQRKNGEVSYYKIVIFKNKKQIQTFKIAPEAPFYNEDYINLTFEDANFDGKIDFLITKFVGMNFDEKYLYLYNDRIFIKKKNFDKIISPTVDTKNKQIVSEYHVGPTEYHREIYKWKKGKLIQIYSQVEGEDY